MQPTAPPPLLFTVPFVGLLLSIALLPMLFPRFWDRRIGVVAGFWCAALLMPLAVRYGPLAALEESWHAILVDYVPFISLLLALFVAGGGILVRGGPFGRPAGNTLLLAIGTLLAGVMGTTGAAMVMVHPLLHANAHRHRKVHLVAFLIILVANVGGATSPLGDPPLYIGFLHGVPFGWPLLNVGLPFLVMAGPLLLVFYFVDRHLAARDPPDPRDRERFHVRGWLNVALIGVVVATVLMQGAWHPGDAVIAGAAIGRERLAAVAILLVVTGLSVAWTAPAIRKSNDFKWHSIVEVAKLFAAIFVTVGPVLTLLAAGPDGPAGPLLRLALGADGRPSALASFWLSGTLSAFLDNAPTYLVFFQMAGGDAARLTGADHTLLAAISAGSVFFGAITYIGNAPNLMVRSIAAHRGVHMPGFFGYMAWSLSLMLPGLIAVALLFFARF